MYGFLRARIYGITETKTSLVLVPLNKRLALPRFSISAKKTNSIDVHGIHWFDIVNSLTAADNWQQQYQ